MCIFHGDPGPEHLKIYKYLLTKEDYVALTEASAAKKLSSSICEESFQTALCRHEELGFGGVSQSWV